MEKLQNGRDSKILDKLSRTKGLDFTEPNCQESWGEAGFLFCWGEVQLRHGHSLSCGLAVSPKLFSS